MYRGQSKRKSTLLKDGRSERTWTDIEGRRQGLSKTWEINHMHANRSNNHLEALHLRWHPEAAKCTMREKGSQ